MSISNLYIKEIFVDNFKSLKNSKIQFKDGLNIIIGKNGAGKSNMLNFIYKYAANNPLRSYRLRGSNTNFSVVLLYNQNGKKYELSITIERTKRTEQAAIRDSNFSFEATISKKNNNKIELDNVRFDLSELQPRRRTSTNEEILKIFNIYRDIETRYISYNLPESENWLTKPARITIDTEGIVSIGEEYSDYGFLLNLEIDIELDYLENIPKKIMNNETLLKNHIVELLNNTNKLSELNEVLRKYTIIQDSRINPNINVYSNDQITIIENLTLEFLIEDDWMPWSYLSDGTKRLFYVISETLTSHTGIILMEEPELGIHPHQLYSLIDFLKEQSLNKQIIISTHSPLLLDALSPLDLDRVIIAKNNKRSIFNPLTKIQIKKAQKYMAEVGDLSYYWLHSDLES